MKDRRLTPANARVALRSFGDASGTRKTVDGVWSRIDVSIADLLASPGGKRDRQVLKGERVLVLDRLDGFAFVQAEKDGYCGYLPDSVLGNDHPVTHWVSAPATHLYTAPSLTQPEITGISHGSRLHIKTDHGRFMETDDGAFVVSRHIRKIGDFLDDPVVVAEGFLGTPYLWGGNSHAGIDCSGLVQAALLACGMNCPGDSDMQLTALGTPLAEGADYVRGDLLFWKGHVAMAVDTTRIIHANGFYAAVTYEVTADAISRIKAQGEGSLLSVNRP